MKTAVRPRRRQGQGMTEYIIVVGLIGIASVTAVTRFKDALKTSWETAEAKTTEQIREAYAAEGITFGE